MNLSPALPSGALLDEVTRLTLTGADLDALALVAVAALIPCAVVAALTWGAVALVARHRRPGEGEAGRECPALAPGLRQTSPDDWGGGNGQAALPPQGAPRLGSSGEGAAARPLGEQSSK